MNINYIQLPAKDITGIDNHLLTPIQYDILSRRVDYSILKEFDYEAKDLINSNFNPMKNLDKLPDVYDAGIMVGNAIKNKKHITVLGDFDNDGLCSTATFEVSFRDVFKLDKSNYTVLVNHRKTGTGITKALIERTKRVHEEHPIDLILICDHGSSNQEAYKLFKDMGIPEIVLTDHHHIEYDNYPVSADCVVNPQRHDSTYYTEVSGCFVAYLTMLTTLKHLDGDEFNFKELDVVLPYVAMSTISDVMSLKYPINRQVVKVGLQEFNSYRNRLWSIIKNVLDISNRITSNDVAFKLAPFFNTGNRVNQEQLAYEILVSTDMERCKLYCSDLLKFSAMRKKAQRESVKESIALIKELPQQHSIVISIESPLAINGIIAGNIGSKYKKPTICFINSDADIITGSGRSIVPNVDLVKIYDNINKADDSILVSYGGHVMAAGCAIHSDKLDTFRNMFDEEVNKALSGRGVDSNVYYDLEIPNTKVNPVLAKDISRLSPYGKDWIKPVFKSNFRMGGVIVMGTIAKLFLFNSNNTKLEAMHFFNSSYGDIDVTNIKTILKSGARVTVTYNLDITTFRNVIDINIIINSIELA